MSGTMKGLLTAVGLMALAVAVSPGCGTPPVYILVSPQVSALNRYVGPQLNAQFSFQQDHVTVEVVNTTDGDAMIRWEQGTFVTHDGYSVPLVPLGRPIYTLPSGSRATVKLTLAQWPCSQGRLWNRRTSLEQHLVPPDALERGNPQVKMIVPVTFIDRQGLGAEQWVFEFAFTVRSSTPGASGAPNPFGGADGLR